MLVHPAACKDGGQRLADTLHGMGITTQEVAIKGRELVVSLGEGYFMRMDGDVFYDSTPLQAA